MGAGCASVRPAEEVSVDASEMAVASEVVAVVPSDVAVASAVPSEVVAVVVVVAATQQRSSPELAVSAQEVCL